MKSRRNILPSFICPEEAPGRSWSPSRRRLSSLPPTPSIDRSEAQGVSLVELARIAREVAQ